MASTTPEAMRGPGSMRRANEWAVLHRLYGLHRGGAEQADGTDGGAPGPSSAPQLAAGTGLSRPTVNLALANLEQAGLVRSTGVRAGRAGRAPRLWEADPGAGRVLAVDLGVHWMRLLLADLAGTVLASRRAPSPGADAGRLASLVGEVLDESGVAADDVLSVVVGSPGYFDPGEGRVRLAVNLPGWERPSVTGRIAAHLGDLGERLAFENDTDLAALGEQAHGLGRGVPDFVYLHIGSGIGMGAVLGGRLHRGAHGAAGEVAFLPIGDVGPATRERGALESAAAADAITAAARREGLRGVTDPAAVFEAARAGRAPAVRAVDGLVERLARALLTVSAVLDPRLVVLGGGVGGHAEFLVGAVRERLAELSPLPLPEVAVSAVGDRAVLLGGLALGTEAARERAFARYAGGG